jgi:hypothetical protein
VKEIPLTQGYATRVSDEDFEWLNQWKWRYAQGYAVRTIPNHSGPRRQAILSMARLIMSAPDGIQVDHANRDTLDNQRSNLRLATSTQNAINQRKRKNKYGMRGVGFDKHNNRWITQIKVATRLRTVGRYSTAFEAALAYDRAARQYHGEFACLNLPPSITAPENQ